MSEGRIIGSDYRLIYSTYVDLVIPPACRTISNEPLGAVTWTRPPGESDVKQSTSLRDEYGAAWHVEELEEEKAARDKKNLVEFCYVPFGKLNPLGIM